MNIQQFKYILSVVDLKNFDQAANHCFISQSTLSTMIGKFEKEIDIKLFNRKTKPVSITKEGEKIIHQIRIINNEIENLHNITQEIKGEISGQLKIGIIPTIAPHILSFILPHFTKKHPHVFFTIKEMTTEEIKKNIFNRSIDIGILALPISEPDIKEHPLYTEPFLLYDCGQRYKQTEISLKHLKTSHLWLLKEGHCMRSQIQKICTLAHFNNKNKSNISFDSGSLESLIQLTKSSQGQTILPYLSTLQLPKHEQKYILSFKDPIPMRSIGMVTHTYFSKKILLKELKKDIISSIKKILPVEKQKSNLIINP